MKNIAILLIFIIGLISCKSSKTAVSPEEFNTIKELVAQKQFEFVADWALPLADNSLAQLANAGLLGIGSTSGRVNLTGNSNFMRFKNDSITADLPFYGERQISSINNNDTGISFNEPPKDYKVTVNEAKRSIDIHFDISDSTESFQVIMNVFRNNRARVTINSTQRNMIRYDGYIKKIEQ